MKRATSALFSWSLRADANSTAPHAVRGGFAVFVLLSVAMAWADSLSAVGPGLRFFTTICYLNVFLITVAGMSYFVSAVTEEKDAGTLALLKLAGAPPLGIMLSKSTSRLISAIMLLMIQLPFTFLAVTLGGVTWDQVIAAYLALMAWLCLVANGALFCSVVSPTSGRAAVRATGLLILLFTIGPLASAIVTMKVPAWLPVQIQQVAAGVLSAYQTLMVGPRLDEILSATGIKTLTGPQFWWSMLCGGGLFAISTLLFNRLAHTPATPNAIASRRVRRFAVSRTWKLFVVWKDFLFYTGGIPGFAGRFVLYGGVVTGYVIFHRFESPKSEAWMADHLAWYCFLTLIGIVTVEGMFYASGLLVHEAEQKTLGPLRLVPAETVWILVQKLMACGIALTPGLFWVGVLLVISHRGIILELTPTMVIWYVFEVLLCAHLTMLLSLHSRWAALPIALFLTAASNMCFPLIVLGLIRAVTSMASVNGLRMGDLTIIVINFIWAWVFVLLPLELEIVKSWNRLAEKL